MIKESEKSIKPKTILSKKTICMVLGATILLSGSIYYTKISNSDKSNSEIVSRQREYTVTKGDITAGANGAGTLKLELVPHNFSESVVIGELFVKEGQVVKKGDKLASTSEKFLEEPSVLYAEVDGVVLSIKGGVGTTTSSDIPFLEIGESAKVYGEIFVTQNDIIKIEEGQKVILEIGPYEDKKFEGIVKSLNLKPNTEGDTTRYSAIVELNDAEVKLLDGMTVRAQFIIKEVKDVLVLSNKAITLKEGKQFVKVKNQDGTISEVEITTGFSDGKNSEIITGLSDGDTVVTGG